MAKKRILNVSTLEPPEPLYAIIDTLDTLVPGEYLKVLHHRQPFPLYPTLDNNGYAHCVREGKETPFEIFIWKNDDEKTGTAVQLIMQSDASPDA